MNLFNKLEFVGMQYLSIEFVKWPWVIGHYRGGKWLNNITREGLFTEET